MSKWVLIIPGLVAALLLVSLPLLFFQPEIGSFSALFSAAGSAIFLALARP